MRKGKKEKISLKREARKRKKGDKDERKKK